MTRNTQFFAAISTTCSTLQLSYVCVLITAFFHPSTSSTPSVRAGWSSWRETRPLQSQPLKQTYALKLLQQCTRYVGLPMHVCGVEAPGLFPWSMAMGLLAFLSSQFAPTINRGPLSASHSLLNVSFLSEAPFVLLPYILSGKRHEL